MIQDLLKEFFVLEYKKNSGKGLGLLRDIPVSDNLIIVRTREDTAEIIFLYNGAKLSIDWRWIDLFNSLNTWGGDRILTEEENNNIWNFTNYMMKFCSMLGVSVIGQEITDLVTELCRIGTKPFIDEVRKNNPELSNTLKPFTFSSINKTIEL
jgi:hypothetical protein